MGNAGGKGASPEKAEALQAVVAKPIVGTKRRVPSVLELLTAQGAAAVVAEGDKSLTDGVASKAVESSGAGDNGEIDADGAMQEQFSSQLSLGTEAGCSASVKDSEDACSDRHRGRSERLGIEQRGALHLGGAPGDKPKPAGSTKTHEASKVVANDGCGRIVKGHPKPAGLIKTPVRAGFKPPKVEDGQQLSTIRLAKEPLMLVMNSLVYRRPRTVIVVVIGAGQWR